jgi:DNA repair protein RecN (Recombination protein N)
MLSRLSIRDFVIVDALELDFAAGFTVLTGETGAGKSILIDALALTLGGRADATIVRAGSERAEITAEFDIGDLPQVARWLNENQLEGDEDVLFLRRTIEAAGRSRAFINGRTATVQQLKEIGEQLVDIHGQHAHQSLLRRDAQRSLLDNLGGLTDLAHSTAERYQTWRRIREAREELSRNAEAVAAERDQLTWQIRELTALAFEPAVWRETVEEHARLSHAASLIEGAEAGLQALSEADGAVISVVTSTLARLQQLMDVDSRLKEITDVLEPAQIQLQEAAYGLRHYLQRIELDPGRLSEVERRLAEVHEIARKYRVTPEELPDLLAAKQSRLDELGGDGNEEALLAREKAAEAAYMESANKLSQGREKASKTMSEQVTASMQTLAMSGGKFEVALQPLASPASFGLEQVEFQVAAHEGMPVGPLAKVASGGELSRISLAVQVILSKIAAVPTLIFDEVDVGIGGRVAEVVGQLLRQLGNTYQVMCVTHLPQVAASGNHHWRVMKSAVAGGVRSRIDPLDAEARIEELARMLGGVKITETTRKHAKEMLGVK